MAGPDLPRPPIEDQLGSGIAPLDGYYVGGWKQGQDPDGKFLATATFNRPAGGDIVVEPVRFTRLGLQVGLLGSQPIDSSAGPEV